jgi:hypothetical protein
MKLQSVKVEILRHGSGMWGSYLNLEYVVTQSDTQDQKRNKEDQEEKEEGRFKMAGCRWRDLEFIFHRSCILRHIDTMS